MNTIELTKELSQNFVDFAHEANCQRAFADARDGLKPGQRACLWEMFTKGYTNNKPHVKSAKISGGTIATWWPHGDTAIYDTFARMSQSWINNFPEVDWHGANGSIQISGEPAASRYTEARLSKIAEEGLLFNIKKHNVNMKLNFSEDDEWPEVFPALLPRLMINGCQGIGSTIANVWLPHNLKELGEIINQYINTGEINYNNIYPDFPTKGIIINKNDLIDIYKTGKGKVILRAKTEIIKNKILITEIPYQVYVEPLIDQIKELIKSEEITNIEDIINKSDKKSLLIEIICEDNPNIILEQLFQKTDLQKTYNANQWALVGKTPKLLSLKDYLDIYLQHNFNCIKKENEFELKKATDRLEIVEGLIKALEDIDNIIALIKNSQNATNAIINLIKKYDFTEKQAKAIVDMKLGKLAKLEKIELNQERNNLISTITNCNAIIQNKEKQKEIYLERFNIFIKKYGDNRRTALTQISIEQSNKEKKRVIPEDVVVIVTQSGDIKRVSKSNFKIQKRNTKGVKNADAAIMTVISTNTIDTLMIFTNTGKMYRLGVDKTPEGTNISKGVSLKSILGIEDMAEKIIAVTSLYDKTDAEYVFFFTKKGYVKKTRLEEYLKVKKSTGIQAIKFGENDSLANVTFIKNEQVIIVSEKGMVIRFSTEGIRDTGRVTKGVKGITLSENDNVLIGLPIKHETDNLAIISKDGKGKRIALEEFSLQYRDGKGNICYPKNDVAAAALIGENDSVLIIGQSNSICISSSEFPLLGRTALGNIILKTPKILFMVKI